MGLELTKSKEKKKKKKKKKKGGGRGGGRGEAFGNHPEEEEHSRKGQAPSSVSRRREAGRRTSSGNGAPRGSRFRSVVPVFVCGSPLSRSAVHPFTEETGPPSSLRARDRPGARARRFSGVPLSWVHVARLASLGAHPPPSSRVERFLDRFPLGIHPLSSDIPQDPPDVFQSLGARSLACPPWVCPSLLGGSVCGGGCVGGCVGVGVGVGVCV